MSGCGGCACRGRLGVFASQRRLCVSESPLCVAFAYRLCVSPFCETLIIGLYASYNGPNRVSLIVVRTGTRQSESQTISLYTVHLVAGTLYALRSKPHLHASARAHTSRRNRPRLHGGPAPRATGAATPLAPDPHTLTRTHACTPAANHPPLVHCAALGPHCPPRLARPSSPF